MRRRAVPGFRSVPEALPAGRRSDVLPALFPRARLYPMMPNRLSALMLLLAPLAASLPGTETVPAAAPAAPAYPAQAAESATPPAYPRINLAPQYEVVPDWPQRPPGIEWAAVSAIALDRAGNVWIYTRRNPTVQVYSPEGRYLQGWTEENPKTVPHGLKFDRDGNVWLVDMGLHVARKFSPEGQLLQVLGTVGVPGEDATHFFQPTDIAFAPNGDIFVSDGYGNSRVVRFDASGKFLNAWGSLGVTPSRFSIPHAIAVDSQGRVYVADRNNVRIQIFSPEGRLLDSWDNVVVPWGFWISPRDEIWVCGSTPMAWRVDPKYPRSPLGCPPHDQVIMQFNPAGRVIELTKLPKGEDGREEPGQVNWLHTIALDAEGNLYAGDIIGKRAQKFLRR